MNMSKSMVIEPKLSCFGWKTYLQRKRGTSKLTVSKIIATGCNLVKGQPLFCYIACDKEDRPMMIAYLDGKPRKPLQECAEEKEHGEPDKS